MPSDGVASAVLALASTAHLVLGMLRAHRSAAGARARLVAAPSFLAAVTPWVFPGAAAVALGLALDALWFALGEKLAPPAAQAAPTARRASPVTTLRVLGVRQETDEIRAFRLDRPAGFDFTAGQYLTVVVPADGRLVSRCYSICSAPSDRKHLEIAVRRQGAVSRRIHETVRTGGTLAARKPAGKFVYPSDSRRPIVLIGGGVGITPLLSMLRHAVASDTDREVTLLLSVRTDRDIPFRDELADLSGRCARIRVVVTASRGAASAHCRSGRLDMGLLLREIPDPKRCVFCMCGPNAMVEDFRAGLVALGVPPEQVRLEAFEASRHGPAGPATNQPHSLELTLSGRTVTVPPGRSLLEAAEAAGVEIPSSCRAGVCQTCRTRLLSGDVECSADCRDETDRLEGWIYPCVAWPRGNCSLEA